MSLLDTNISINHALNKVKYDDKQHQLEWASPGNHIAFPPYDSHSQCHLPQRISKKRLERQFSRTYPLNINDLFLKNKNFWFFNRSNSISFISHA